MPLQLDYMLTIQPGGTHTHTRARARARTAALTLFRNLRPLWAALTFTFVLRPVMSWWRSRSSATQTPSSQTTTAASANRWPWRSIWTRSSRGREGTCESWLPHSEHLRQRTKLQPSVCFKNEHVPKIRLSFKFQIQRLQFKQWHFPILINYWTRF